MNKLYLVSWIGGEEVCYLIAPNASQAKSMAMKHSPKAQDADFISLRVNITEPWEGLDLSEPAYLFDVETNQDVEREELAWYWSQQ